jgi:hypothetical protein
MSSRGRGPSGTLFDAELNVVSLGRTMAIADGGDGIPRCPAAGTTVEGACESWGVKRGVASVSSRGFCNGGIVGYRRGGLGALHAGVGPPPIAWRAGETGWMGGLGGGLPRAEQPRRTYSTPETSIGLAYSMGQTPKALRRRLEESSTVPCPPPKAQT